MDPSRPSLSSGGDHASSEQGQPKVFFHESLEQFGALIWRDLKNERNSAVFFLFHISL